jgi:hypothetical protein
MATPRWKIRNKQPLSPVLLVRGDLVRGFPLQVAGGYHRVCASHLVDENTAIPCRLIDLPAPAARPRTTRARVQATVPALEVPPVASAPIQVPVRRAPAKRTPAKKVAAARKA